LSTPSVFSAIQKLYLLLTPREKLKWLGIIGFALVTSVFEIMTASLIVVFAQVLSKPEFGQRYLFKLGITETVSSERTIFYMAIAFGGIYFIKNIWAAAEVFYQNFSIQKMCYRFKTKLLYRFTQADYNFYLTRNSSYGFTVVNSDTEGAFSYGMISLSTIISEGIVFSCLTLMIVYLNPSLAIFIFAIGLVLAILIPKYLFPLFYCWGQRLQEASLLATQHLTQFFHGFKEIILLGKQESFIEAFQVHSRLRSNTHAIQTATNALPRMVIEILFIGLFVAAISYLCMEKDTPQQMMGILGGYLYLGFRLMPGLNRIWGQLNLFKSMIPHIERLYQEYTSQISRVTYNDIPGFVFKKSISLKNVSFRYLNTEKNTLDTINLNITKGEYLGIVGETGSGKSTLIDLILGLLKPSEGDILIDDKYPCFSRQWHQLVGYVPQTLYLTDDTIKANIAFGEKSEDIDGERLNKAIDDAQLRLLIDKLPEGIETFVGERGIRLSGGERQRISIARALYRNPEVLIFDEATSSLDNETEKRLMETIHALSKDRTVIMVAHRTSTLKNCDRIVVMGKGTISNIISYDLLKARG